MMVLKISIFIADLTKSYPCIKKAMYFYSKTPISNNRDQLITYLSMPLYLYKDKKKKFIEISEDKFDILEKHQVFNKTKLVLPVSCNILFDDIEYSDVLFWLNHHYSLYYSFNHINIQSLILDDIFSIFLCHWKKLHYIDLILMNNFISNLVIKNPSEDLKTKLLIAGISQRLSIINSSILDCSISELSPTYH